MNKKQIKTSVIILSLTLIMSCGGWWCWRLVYQPDVDNRLARADSLMFIRPDSSLRILEGIENADAFDEGNKALYALLLTQARYRNYLPLGNDSLINIALDYYATEGDMTHRGWAHFYAAQIYRDLGDTYKAIAHINKAAAACANDNRLSFYVYCHWGELLQSRKPYDEGLGKFNEAEKYAWLMNDTSNVSSILDLKGWSNLYKHDYVKATDDFQSALALSEQIDDKGHCANLHKSLALTYSFRKEPAVAKYHIDKAFELRQYADEDSFAIYSIKGDILTEMGQCDSAEYYLRKGRRTNDIYHRAGFDQNMAKLEAKRGDYRKAYECELQYAETLDSIAKKEENDRTMAIQKQYDSSSIREEKDRLEIQNKHKTIALLTGALVLVCLTFAGYFITVRMRRRSRLLQEKAFVSSQQLSEKNSKLQNEILSHSTSMAKIKRLRTLKDKDKIAWEQDLKFDKHDEDDFLNTMNFCDSSFVKNLENACANLSKADLLLCCLQRKNLINRDIAILLGVSLATLKKRKTRLRKEKLASCMPQDQLLEDFVMSFPFEDESDDAADNTDATDPDECEADTGANLQQ